MENLSRDALYEQKWQKFLGRIWPFKFIPFVDFVLAAGSLATGNMREESDFDVIVGVRQGRIFTARAFCVLAFGMFGWRAKHKRNFSRHSHGFVVSHRVRDKICLNHFVTPAAYRLSPPYNEYWKNLYQKLVPIYGSPEIIQKFFNANADWTGTVRNSLSKGSLGLRLRAGAVSNGIGWLLSGWFGDWLEKNLKAIQVKRIESSLKSQTGYKPRIIFNDNELEFHPDTRRIELLINE